MSINITVSTDVAILLKQLIDNELQMLQDRKDQEDDENTLYHAEINLEMAQLFYVYKQLEQIK